MFRFQDTVFNFLYCKLFHQRQKLLYNEHYHTRKEQFCNSSHDKIDFRPFYFHMANYKSFDHKTSLANIYSQGQCF